MTVMKKLFENWNKYILNEGGLSRFAQHIEAHDCAVISAYRGDPSDLSKCVGASAEAVPAPAPMAEGRPSHPQNKKKSAELRGLLMGMGYGVTRVDGSYIENFDTPQAMEVAEESYFCVNLKDDPSFFDSIQKLGEKFCQDSVLCIPAGGVGAYLFGTNNADFPGYGESMTVGDMHLGKEAEFMTRTRGRPMTFNESDNKLETYSDLSKNQRMAVRAMTNKFLKENDMARGPAITDDMPMSLSLSQQELDLMLNIIKQQSRGAGPQRSGTISGIVNALTNAKMNDVRAGVSLTKKQIDVAWSILTQYSHTARPDILPTIEDIISKLDVSYSNTMQGY